MVVMMPSANSIPTLIKNLFEHQVLSVMIILAMLLPSMAVSRNKLVYVHKERSLQPGEVILFEVRSPEPLRDLSVAAFGRTFSGFAEDDGRKWVALVGIDLDTKPGRYSIRISATGREGSVAAVDDTLAIAAKEFPTRKLTVDEKYVSPPADVLARIEKERERVNGIFAHASPDRIWQGQFINPVPGKVISAFGKRSMYNGRLRSSHTGVDFRGAVGTPIRAPNAGIVVLAEDLYYSGKTVILDHGQGLYSYLGHMSAFSVKEGDRVEKGDLVGKVGATGRVTGPHLHWTIRLAGSRIDPISLVDLLRIPPK